MEVRLAGVAGGDQMLVAGQRTRVTTTRLGVIDLFPYGFNSEVIGKCRWESLQYIRNQFYYLDKVIALFGSF